MHTCVQAGIHVCMHACMHTYMHGGPYNSATNISHLFVWTCREEGKWTKGVLQGPTPKNPRDVTPATHPHTPLTSTAKAKPLVRGVHDDSFSGIWNHNVTEAPKVFWRLWNAIQPWSKPLRQHGALQHQTRSSRQSFQVRCRQPMFWLRAGAGKDTSILAPPLSHCGLDDPRLSATSDMGTQLAQNSTLKKCILIHSA